MAKMSVADARAFAQLLTAAADKAEAAGASEFDLDDAASAAQDAGLDELAAALKGDAARPSGT